MARSDISVRVENLQKYYGNVAGVKDVDFTVPAGTTVTLLGPSGCGKTTTLRCIAGLEVPTAGRISLGDRVVFDGEKGVFLEPEHRRIGMVFQSYAIWPHMTVGGNVGFPLTIARTPAREVRERTMNALELVGLGELYDRSAAQLSGGQQQRVALARAIIHEPSVVLFDEPLSNLDANLRERMRSELQLLQSRLGFTSIFVTHDQEEALSLSDRIVLMNAGRVEQSAAPTEMFQEPATVFAAKFLGYANVVPGELTTAAANDSRHLEVRFEDGHTLRGRWRSSEAPAAGQPVSLAFRADRIGISEAPADIAAGTLAGEVEASSFLGDCVSYIVRVGGTQIKVNGPVEHPARRGDRVVLTLNPEHCHIFPETAAAA